MKYWIAIGGLMLAASVLLGALGNHYFASELIENEGKEAFFRGHFYLVVHSIGLILSSIIFKNSDKKHHIPAALFLSGMILFCGSVMLRSLGIIESSNLAPLGGMSFVVGWLSFGYLALMKK